MTVRRYFACWLRNVADRMDPPPRPQVAVPYFRIGVDMDPERLAAFHREIDRQRRDTVAAWHGRY